MNQDPPLLERPARQGALAPSSQLLRRQPTISSRAGTARDLPTGFPTCLVLRLRLLQRCGHALLQLMRNPLHLRAAQGGSSRS